VAYRNKLAPTILIALMFSMVSSQLFVLPGRAQGPTIDNPAPDASKSDGIYTPFTNREIYQLIASDYQEIVRLTNEVLQGRPIPSGEILRVYELAQYARIGTGSRPLRGFARDEARATEFPEGAAYSGSATFLDDPVIAAIGNVVGGTGSAAGFSPAQRRQLIQKGVLRIIYHWTAHYLDRGGQNLNPGLVDEAWAIYMGTEVDGRYPNSLSATAVSREGNFNRGGTIDAPLRQALSRAQRAAANRDSAAYAEASREVYSRLHAIFYLGTVRYLNEPLKSVAAGNIDNALVQLAEGLAFYHTIQPHVGLADPDADAAILAFFNTPPAELTVGMRNAALEALNRNAGALSLGPNDLVTVSMLESL
jgi:hypothetical protein